MENNKVAIIESKKSKNDYKYLFGNNFEFDLYQLCSDPSVTKVLKANTDIDPLIPERYDWIILVGSEPTKYFTSISSVTAYSGKLVDEKFIPVINPSMLAFKAEAKRLWEASRDNICGIISGEIKKTELTSEIYEGVNTESRALKVVKEALEHPNSIISLDSETSGLYPRDGYVLGVSICYDGKKGYYISSDVITPEIEGLFQTIWDKKTVIFHNAKFDLSMLEYHFGWNFNFFEDTMLLHYIITEQPGTHGLKQLALSYTPYGDYEKELRNWIDSYCKSTGTLKGNFNYEVIPFEVMVPYASLDALVTFLLYEKFCAIKKNTRLRSVYDNILIPATRALVGIQNNGVPFHRGRLNQMQKQMEEEISEAYDSLMNISEIKRFKEVEGKEFNPNSPTQLRKILFDYLNLPISKKTPTGAPSTDKEVLESLAEMSDIPKMILTVRTKSKIKNTYIDKILPNLDKDGRLRTNFNIHSTTSGRLSSSGKMNMQQIPRDDPSVKGCIKARPGHKIISMDLQTAEMYIAAALSGDISLMGVFKDAKDFHSSIASQVFNLKGCNVDEVKEHYATERQASKAVSFGILYGATAKKISSEISKSSAEYFSVSRANDVINKYFKTYSQLKKWIDSNVEFISQNGFIYSFFGRKRRVPDVKSQDKGLAAHEVRSALNFLIQSVASDINLLACIDMERYIRDNKMQAKIFALVHDSILAEVPEDEIEEYTRVLQEFVQKDRGISIKDSPIKCDFEIGDDYSFGKFEKVYGDTK